MALPQPECLFITVSNNIYRPRCERLPSEAMVHLLMCPQDRKINKKNKALNE